MALHPSFPGSRYAILDPALRCLSPESVHYRVKPGCTPFLEVTV